MLRHQAHCRNNFLMSQFSDISCSWHLFSCNVSCFWLLWSWDFLLIWSFLISSHPISPHLIPCLLTWSHLVSSDLSSSERIPHLSVSQLISALVSLSFSQFLSVSLSSAPFWSKTCFKTKWISAPKAKQGMTLKSSKSNFERKRNMPKNETRKNKKNSMSQLWRSHATTICKHRVAKDNRVIYAGAILMQPLRCEMEAVTNKRP